MLVVIYYVLTIHIKKIEKVYCLLVMLPFCHFKTHAPAIRQNHHLYRHRHYPYWFALVFFWQQASFSGPPPRRYPRGAAKFPVLFSHHHPYPHQPAAFGAALAHQKVFVNLLSIAICRPERPTFAPLKTAFSL